MIQKMADELEKNVHITDTLFYTYLQAGEAHPIKSDFLFLELYLIFLGGQERACQGSFNQTTIYIPINMPKRWHWYLCVLMKKEKQISIFDSGKLLTA